jgi:drug/metabolite transporter (DMT)-like permease
MQNHSLLFGILCGIATGAFWGIPFLAPQILSDYTAIYLTLGRFGFFGLVSLLFLPQVIQYLKNLNRRDLWQVFLLSLSGFSIYSFLLFWSVPKAGGVAAALIIGLLPITISLFGFKEQSLRKSFYIGIIFIFAGLLLLTLPSLQMADTSAGSTMWGYVGCVVCLALWTWFANQNSKFLRKHPTTNPKIFSAVMGVLSLLVVLPMVFILTDQPLAFLIGRSDIKVYIFWSLLLGLGASWAANWLWNICSRACPPQISGPLIVSETFFGLLYTFIYELRFPSLTEALSILLSISGVLICIRSQMKKPKAH